MLWYNHFIWITVVDGMAMKMPFETKRKGWEPYVKWWLHSSPVLVTERKLWIYDKSSKIRGNWKKFGGGFERGGGVRELSHLKLTTSLKYWKNINDFHFQFLLKLLLTLTSCTICYESCKSSYLPCLYTKAYIYIKSDSNFIIMWTALNWTVIFISGDYFQILCGVFSILTKSRLLQLYRFFKKT